MKLVRLALLLFCAWLGIAGVLTNAMEECEPRIYHTMKNLAEELNALQEAADEALFEAVKNKNVWCIREFFCAPDRGNEYSYLTPNPNARDEFGKTPLHHAVENEDEVWIRALVRNGANADLMDLDGTSPRQIAEENGISHYLEESEAAVRFNGSLWRKRTPSLMDSVALGDVNRVQAILAGDTCTFKELCEVYQRASEKKLSNITQAKIQELQTGRALGNGNALINTMQKFINCTELVENKIKSLMDAPDADPNQLLKDAVEARCSSVAYALLADKNADVNFVDNETGETLWHCFLTSEDQQLLNYLLVHASNNINVQDNNGLTPLWHAAYGPKRDGALFELLLENGADINVPNGEGKTLLYAAVEKGELNAVLYFLDHGADPNWYYEKQGSWLNIKETALHYAARKGQARIVALLLERGAEPKILDLNGQTPAQVVPDYAESTKQLFSDKRLEDSWVSIPDNLSLTLEQQAERDQQAADRVIEPAVAVWRSTGQWVNAKWQAACNLFASEPAQLIENQRDQREVMQPSHCEWPELPVPGSVNLLAMSTIGGFGQSGVEDGDLEPNPELLTADAVETDLGNVAQDFLGLTVAAQVGDESDDQVGAVNHDLMESGIFAAADFEADASDDLSMKIASGEINPLAMSMLPGDFAAFCEQAIEEPSAQATLETDLDAVLQDRVSFGATELDLPVVVVPDWLIGQLENRGQAAKLPVPEMERDLASLPNGPAPLPSGAYVEMPSNDLALVPFQVQEGCPDDICAALSGALDGNDVLGFNAMVGEQTFMQHCAHVLDECPHFVRAKNDFLERNKAKTNVMQLVQGTLVPAVTAQIISTSITSSEADLAVVPLHPASEPSSPALPEEVRQSNVSVNPIALEAQHRELPVVLASAQPIFDEALSVGETDDEWSLGWLFDEDYAPRINPNVPGAPVAPSDDLPNGPAVPSVQSHVSNGPDQPPLVGQGGDNPIPGSGNNARSGIGRSWFGKFQSWTPKKQVITVLGVATGIGVISWGCKKIYNVLHEKYQIWKKQQQEDLSKEEGPVDNNRRMGRARRRPVAA